MIAVGTLFYWFVFREDPVKAMNLRCNIKALESNLIGRPLPKYEFVDQDGKDGYQNLTRGKMLVVVFLTRCGACRTEFDFLESHYDKLSSKFGIAAVTSESGQSVEKFNEERKMFFPVYSDVQGGLMIKEQVSCTPTLLFLEDGIVRNVRVGVTENYEDLMEGFQL